ncbi:CAP domain-containing protein [Aerococcus viridans]|uniref:CAP domain-containing protein n=1 Tax=Aerococcus viridans TaxID=1377 RepID=UPI0039AFCD3F
MTEKIEASINAFRVENGEKVLPVSQRSRNLSDADAKQNISSDYMTWSADHNENAIGTTFSIIGATNEDNAVQKAMTNWINSPGHHDAMLWDDNGDIGASVYVMKTDEFTI